MAIQARRKLFTCCQVLGLIAISSSNSGGSLMPIVGKIASEDKKIHDVLSRSLTGSIKRKH